MSGKAPTEPLTRSNRPKAPRRWSLKTFAGLIAVSVVLFVTVSLLDPDLAPTWSFARRLFR
jgi:hypothetical protein